MPIASWIRPAFGRENQATRERWLQEQLLALPTGSELLDAGAGTRRYQRFCSHLKYVSQDFCQYDGVGDSQGLHGGSFSYGPIDIVSDIVDIPRPDSSFDAILCVEVLEHTPYPHRAIREFARLLRPGGRLILTAPFASLTHLAPYHFYSGFNKYWFERVLADFGFSIITAEANGDYLSLLAQELQRLSGLVKAAGKSQFLRFAIGGLALIMTGSLSVLRRRLPSTADLACYGFHVVAVKNR